MRVLSLFVLSATLALFRAAPPNGRTLDIYVVDVEGGKATLVVSPSRESLLIDTGNIGEGAARDVQRIMAAINEAGLKQIDHLVTTHWHRDHVGGMALLADRIPIREFIDHGRNEQPDPLIDAFLRDTYPRLYGKAMHRVVKAGEKIPMTGMDVSVVASAGEVIRTPLPGAGKPNPYCAESKAPAAENGENGQSIGLQITFAKFRLVDLGDLSDDKEFELMCPNNPLGGADLLMVSHHGQPRSNSTVFVHAIESRVAIMNNGVRKGGQPEVMKVLYSAPRLENLWQLHFSELSGREYNAPGLFIANLVADERQSMAHWIKVSAQDDGSFIVANARNGFTKTYRVSSD